MGNWANTVLYLRTHTDGIFVILIDRVSQVRFVRLSELRNGGKKIVEAGVGSDEDIHVDIDRCPRRSVETQGDGTPDRIRQFALG